MFYENFKGFRGRDDIRGGHHDRHQRHERFGGNFGGFGQGRHGGFRGRWRGDGRMFASGDLRYVILQLISEKPSYGYEIIKSIQERLGGNYAPSPGVVYPMLTMLEEMGYASVVTEGTRKLYTITPEGAKALAENKATVDAIFAMMDSRRAEFASQRPQQIERAIENLRMALRMKMGSLTTEQIHAVTDIIDNAAKQIERI
ncbi:MAG TPA: PadR family transcriptional regulator [Edaphobacter sp.]